MTFSRLLVSLLSTLLTSLTLASPAPLVFDVQTSPFTLIDVGTPGPGVGDTTVFDDRLFQDGKEVGSGSGFCTITRFTPEEVHPFRLVCTATYVLPDGTLAVQGIMTDSPLKTLTVVGGSGSYRGVTGTLEFLEHGDGTGKVTLHLQTR